MGTTYYQDGKTIDGFIAPVAGVVKDVPVIIGGQFVVPQETATSGNTFLGSVSGVHGPFVKDTSSAAVVGEPAYFKPSDGKFYATAAADRAIVGVFAVAAGASAATCYVKLADAPVALIGVPGDIQGVTAGTGLTGGGTSGTVTVGLDAGSVASLGKADTAVQPVAAPTAGNFAGLDAAGLVTDSGSKAADFATSAQGGKADTAVQPAAITNMVTAAAVGTDGHLAVFDGATRAIKDGGLPGAPANDSVTAAMLKVDCIDAFAFGGGDNDPDAGGVQCTCVGAKVGDKVMSIVNLTPGGAGTGAEADFEGTISVADKIVQTGVKDLSAEGFLVILLRRGA